MTRAVSFTAVYEDVEGGWVQARVRELPEVITAGRTVDDAKELLLDALFEYLQSLGERTSEPLESAQPRAEGKLEISLSA